MTKANFQAADEGKVRRRLGHQFLAITKRVQFLLTPSNNFRRDKPRVDISKYGF
jgi:hypothetical protein